MVLTPSQGLHRARRLSCLLLHLKKLPSSAIVLQGTSVQLPLRASPRTPEENTRGSPSFQDLIFFRYSFSVYGGVHPYPSSNGLSLFLTCRVDRAWVLFRFFSAFGGILDFKDRGGGAAVNLSWRVSGDQAAHVAGLLAKEYSRKQKQLLIASQWHSRTARVAELKNLKATLRNNFFEVPELRTWTELAELFDSGGHISLVRPSFIPRVGIYHKNSLLLSSVVDFLRSRELPLPPAPAGISLLTSERRHCRFVWSCQKREVVCDFLKGILKGGVTFKRRECEEALELIEGQAESGAVQADGKGYARIRNIKAELGCVSNRAHYAKYKYRDMMRRGRDEEELKKLEHQNECLQVLKSHLKLKLVLEKQRKQILYFLPR